MFECPKCGYRDAPEWRTSRFVIYAVYCTFEELVNFDPDLAMALKENRRVEKGPYLYWLRGRVPHVYRIHKELKDFMKSNKTEKPRIPDPVQAKLKEFMG